MAQQIVLNVPHVLSNPPEEEKKHLPFALELFQEMMSDPESVCCPIGGSVFEDPVFDSVGHTYDRVWIVRHFSQQREQSRPLTSPLSGEAVNGDLLTPNRVKKSEVEEYKVQKANRCFELAKQCIQSKCGDTAVMLLNRVKQLNPKQEGLSEIETVAHNTFISDQRKREVCCLRAKELLEKGHAKEALALLKPLQVEAAYTFSLGNETALPIFNSSFVALSVDCKLLVTRPLGKKHKGSYAVWDVEKKAEVNRLYLPADMQSLGENRLGKIKEDGKSFYIYNFISGKDYALQLDTHHFFNFADVNNRKCEKLLEEQRLLEDCCEGLVLSPNHGVIGLLIRSEINTRVCKAFFFKGEGTLGWDNKKTESARYVLMTFDGKFIEIQHQELNRGHNSSLSEQFVDTHLPELKTNRKPLLWYHKYPSTGQGHPAEHLKPSKGKIAGLYRDRVVTRLNYEGPHTADQKDERFYVYSITRSYKGGDTEFNKALLQGAVLENDVESYLNAVEHLVEIYSQNKDWKTLEQWTLNLQEKSEPLRQKLCHAIEESAEDAPWASRLYVYRGLLEQLSVKQGSYEKALQLNPEDSVVQTAVRYIKTQPALPPIVLGQDYQQLAEKVQKQQEQIDKLEKLVQSLLEQIKK